MNERGQISIGIREGVVSGFPIIFGYFPVAMAFGLLSKNTGISLKDSGLFSIMVFAGASQFMALDLIKASIATGNIILATFLLNLRHLMMSASLSVRLKEIKRYWLLFIAFGITDETFSVSSLSNKELNVPYLLTLHTVSYCSWILGTISGYIVGAALPPAVQDSLGIGLYAMFMALLVPEIRKARPVLFLSLLSGGLYVAFSCLKLFPASWRLIASIVISAALGVLFIETEEEEGEK